MLLCYHNRDRFSEYAVPFRYIRPSNAHEGCMKYEDIDGLRHTEGESFGMGGEKRLGRKGPPQFGDQWGSSTSKSVV